MLRNLYCFCFCEGFEVSTVDRDWVGKLIFSLFWNSLVAFSSHHPLSSEFKFENFLMIKGWFASSLVSSHLAFLSLTSLSSWVFIKPHGLLVPHSSIHWYLAFFFPLLVWKTISFFSFIPLLLIVLTQSLPLFLNDSWFCRENLKKKSLSLWMSDICIHLHFWSQLKL